MIRKVLTLLLLILFSSEILALASALREEREAPVSNIHQLVAHEVCPSFSLLAEGPEERDQRNDVVFVAEREVLHPHVFPLIDHCKVYPIVHWKPHSSVLPLYTLHRTLII